MHLDSSGLGSPSQTTATKIAIGAYFALVFGVAAGVLAYEALSLPSVQYLARSAQGEWLVHPETPTGQLDATFALQVDLPSPPPSLPVRITAMREYQLRVNGTERPLVKPENWKVPVSEDLGPLLKSGPNEIRIYVANWTRPPALLVEGPPEVRTDSRWTVALPEKPEVGAVVAHRDESFLRDKPNRLRSSERADLYELALGVYLAFIAFALIPVRFKPWRKQDTVGDAGTPSRRKKWLTAAVCTTLFVGVVALEARNAWVFPPKRGFDPIQHFEYVEYVHEHREVPLADEGWEFQQPPLYYALAALVYEAFGADAAPEQARKAVQMLSPMFSAAVLVLAWILLRTLFPSHPRMQFLGFAFAALLPVRLYISPEITNELLSAFVIGGAVWLAAWQVHRGRARLIDALVLGIVCGLGLLSKYTALFVPLSLLALAGLRFLAGGTRSDTPRDATGRRSWPRTRQILWALMLTGTTFAISGWLYIRNYREYGNAFMAAWDPRSRFRIVQPPGYRSSNFLTSFGDFLWQDLGRTRHSSFWDGMYGSLWADTHGMFLNQGLADLQVAATLSLWLAILPMTAVVLGFGIALHHLITRQWDHPYFVLVMATTFMLASTLLFNLEQAFYSMMKAHWSLWLLPSASVFAALGLETMCQQAGWGRWLIYVDLVALWSLVAWLYWYRGPWVWN